MNADPYPGADPLCSAMIDSPVGSLRVVASSVGVRAVLWSGDDATRVPDRARVDLGATASPGMCRTIDEAALQLAEYFDGTRIDFDVPIDAIGSEFQQAAWLALRQIPFGETISYREQAARMGDQSKARAVGAANGRNPISIIVPCHRVIGSDGSLTGYAGGVDSKRYLLDHERRVSGQSIL